MENHRLNRSIQALWRKYCGISDEYRMLKTRWLFLTRKYNPVIPELTDMFNSLDKLAENLERNFNDIGLERGSEAINPKISIYAVKEIQYHLFDLAVYVGFLKLAFFQRTVSLEIPQLESVIPHSPERTIGNEMLYVAADVIARDYADSLKISSKWDGFVTFAPPIGRETFQGAFFRTFPPYGLYHLSMSEEEKYFLGSYLMLAHEFGHAAINDNRHLISKIQTDLIEKIKLSDEHKERSCKLSSTELKIWENHCSNCHYNPRKIKEEWNENYNYRSPFDELFADIIAIEISGVHILTALFDEIFSPFHNILYLPNIMCEINPMQLEIIMRMRGGINYSKLKGYKFSEELDNDFREVLRKNDKEIKQKLFLIKNNEAEYKDICDFISVIENMCLPCVSFIGETIARYIFDLQQSGYIFKFINEKGFIKCTDESIMTIKNALTKGLPVPEYSPKLIIHAYYEAFRDGSNPNFGAAIYSLVYNVSKDTTSH